jgi:ATP:cob(I)alamin adenosyltransferase
MDDSLPPLTSFIIPGGDDTSSRMHVCRAVCRRAERSTLAVVATGDADAVVTRYLNRLSDFFFVAARYVCQQNGSEEVEYKKPREPKKVE